MSLHRPARSRLRRPVTLGDWWRDGLTRRKPSATGGGGSRVKGHILFVVGVGEVLLGFRLGLHCGEVGCQVIVGLAVLVVRRKTGDKCTQELTVVESEEVAEEPLESKLAPADSVTVV